MSYFILTMQEQINTLNVQVESLKAKKTDGAFKTLRTNLEKSQKRTNGHDDSIRLLHAQLSSLNATLKTLQDNVKKENSQNNVRSRVTTLTTDVDSIKTGMAGIGGDISKLQSQIQQHDAKFAEMTELQRKVDGQAADVAKVTAAMEGVKIELMKATKQNKTELSQEITKMEKVDKVRAMVEAVNRTQNDATRRLAHQIYENKEEGENGMSEMREKIISINETMVQELDSLSFLFSGFKNLSAKFQGEMKRDMKGYTVKLNSTDKNVEEIKQNLSQQIAQSAKLTEGLNFCKSNLNTTQKEVAGLREMVESQDSMVNKHHSMIAKHHEGLHNISEASDVSSKKASDIPSKKKSDVPSKVEPVKINKFHQPAVVGSTTPAAPVKKINKFEPVVVVSTTPAPLPTTSKAAGRCGGATCGPYEECKTTHAAKTNKTDGDVPHCVCKSGYTKVGTCGSYEDCKTVGGDVPQCVCKAGFTKPGTCGSMEECKTVHGDVPQCVCKAGYTKVGKSCEKDAVNPEAETHVVATTKGVPIKAEGITTPPPILAKVSPKPVVNSTNPPNTSLTTSPPTSAAGVDAGVKSDNMTVEGGNTTAGVKSPTVVPTAVPKTTRAARSVVDGGVNPTTTADDEIPTPEMPDEQGRYPDPNDDDNDDNDDDEDDGDSNDSNDNDTNNDKE